MDYEEMQTQYDSLKSELEAVLDQESKLKLARLLELEEQMTIERLED